VANSGNLGKRFGASRTTSSVEPGAAAGGLYPGSFFKKSSAFLAVTGLF
jgi:hypothetical protein